MIGGFQVGAFQPDFQQVQGTLMPNLIGLSWYYAQQVIEENDWRSADTQRLHLNNTQSLDTVLAQYPPAGTVMTDAEVVTLWVDSRAYLSGVTIGIYDIFGLPP